MKDRQSGLTLVEVMVVTLILAVLCGILLSVLPATKRKAQVAHEANSFRQMAVAAQLYADTYDGRRVYSLRTLVESQGLAVELCSSPADPTRAGLGNTVLERMAEPHLVYQSRIDPFRQSFLDIDDFNFQSYVVEDDPEVMHAGWVISLTETSVLGQSEPLPVQSGTFTRLTFDGAMVRRPVDSLWTGGQGDRFLFFPLFFLDATEAWVRKREQS